VHIFRHLFVCFQTSVYMLGEFHKNRNNSAVFVEMSVSTVDLTPPTLQIQCCYSLILYISSCKSSYDVDNEMARNIARVKLKTIISL
jgi:hypothetical protein